MNRKTFACAISRIFYKVTEGLGRMSLGLQIAAQNYWFGQNFSKAIAIDPALLYAGLQLFLKKE